MYVIKIKFGTCFESAASALGAKGAGPPEPEMDRGLDMSFASCSKI